jgi:glycogen phosphorylase
MIRTAYAGKAHPHDEDGKRLISDLFRKIAGINDRVKMVYLPNFDMDLARIMASGADLWLNTPEPPKEASGTSGMKAAVNGVPSLSILDGWWVEGCIEGVTGWPIGTETGPHDRDTDAAALYGALEHRVLPTFYRDRERYTMMMRHAIALNGSFFNTERMMEQYVVKAYFT